MSAVLNFFARDENVPVKCSLVVVPATDMRYLHPRNKRLNEKNCPYESARWFQDVPWSPMGREQWFLKYWLGDDEAVQDEILNNDWRMTPILAPDFKNLPPTHFVTAEFDLARDETKVFEELLRHAGNQVTSKQYAGMPHAFAMYNHPTRGLAKSWEYLEDTARLLREAHGCADL
ncbi:hypothetical protein LTR72_010145 [Exophiala xenobiotica]|nr:hypothetical protein LTR41_009677 [Exophiala xenobiotica]KAK5216775.1 hypothetical protein LTR72_010145 [Exophiala xenobiotica]KAK5286837.1 hypothetical protein LTR14_009582 [Exophiala xenobiotica]KAK5318200.1 hypothetical protein LTR93_008246 [Exophiala xenobiotica]KAK5478041.1 hypothetical protein LTR55_008025 [Exophiala xenobiotica]